MSEPRVLLVDDEELVLMSLARILRREPFEILTATSAEAAFLILEDQSVDLILSDYRMPGMNGIDFLKVVRDKWINTVRMMLTAHADPGELEAAVHAGIVQRAFRKPWDTQELRAALYELLYV